MTAAPRRRRERGAVTAELAMALPLLLSLTVGLVWLLSVGAAQIRVVDAARESARAHGARRRRRPSALAVGRRVAPAGAEVAVSRDGDRVVATARSVVEGPGGLFGFLPEVTVEAEATALAEDDAG